MDRLSTPGEKIWTILEAKCIFVEMDMFDDVCEDLTREDPSFVGWEAIKSQGNRISYSICSRSVVKRELL